MRTLAECLEESERDLTVQDRPAGITPHLRQRAAVRRVQTRYQAQMNAHAFLSGKLLEMRQRHNKYESTPYSLEPNCKESPGGLRDLHTMIWLARAAGLGSSWQALAGKGLITDSSAASSRTTKPC